MIGVKIGSKIYDFPEGWHELTIGQLKVVHDGVSLLEYLKLFMPVKDIELIPEHQAQELAELVTGYLGNDIEAGELPKHIEHKGQLLEVPTDVTRLPSLFTVQFELFAKDDMPLYEKLQNIVSITLQFLIFDTVSMYNAEQIKDQFDHVTVLDAFTLVQVYAQQLKDGFAKFPTHKPKGDEISANPKRLQSFGFWGALYSLADNDLTKMQRLFSLPLEEVLAAQSYNSEQAAYQERLRKLMQK